MKLSLKKILNWRLVVFVLSVIITLAIYATALLALYGYRCQTLDANAPLFHTRRVVFYPQHQDDETLWAAGAIRNAVQYQGPDNVYVVLVSAGTGLKFFKNPMPGRTQ